MVKKLKGEVVTLESLTGTTTSELLVKIRDEGQAVLTLPSVPRAAVTVEIVKAIPGLQATLEGTTKVIVTVK